ncbi:glycine cleavage system aminomethyltransferase GcvT [Haloferula rosea]|uniref:Aminomethyltransferase n=1 Tax=Haloferula rosea TaxID=490093 RepID=A0A934RCL8_9BACT|nr:glycine cleavage system aminomethyltransferase GcvT [Haloferula rosea]MBK1827127.1 glycine cleavage system aminomethyltransferase GcvT [Haloferula rosea]
MSEPLQHSPLEPLHVELGGRMVPFAGWNMPVMYDSILNEHQAVRGSVGIFDISHMGQFIVKGEGALEWLNRMLANNLAKLADGQGQYSFMLNEQGGVIDDLIVYRTGANEFFLVVNASMIPEDFTWLEKQRPDGVELLDESESWAGMAVQGPDSAAAFAKLFPDEPLPPRNGIARLSGGQIVCRTGYTGEDGFEFFCPSADGITAFKQFCDAGAKPCGLGARDSLRLEMCYPLNGSDLSPARTPIEAGLGFFVDLEKGDFVGRDVLARQKEEGLKERLVAIAYTGKGAPPRAHYQVLSESGEVLGELSSGVPSPSLGKGIGLAYLPVAYAKIGTKVQVDVRGRPFPAEVVKKPFYKPAAKNS